MHIPPLVYLNWIFGIFGRGFLVLDLVSEDKEESTHLDRAVVVQEWGQDYRCNAVTVLATMIHGMVTQATYNIDIPG